MRTLEGLKRKYFMHTKKYESYVQFDLASRVESFDKKKLMGIESFLSPINVVIYYHHLLSTFCLIQTSL
jgi:hypothetical protein